jgi:cytochrome c biogenesis protein CcdA
MEYRKKTERTSRKTFGNFAMFFSIGMGLIYFGFGVFVIFSEPGLIAIEPTWKYILGVVLILWGCMRFFRAYQQRTKERHRKYED